MSNLHFQPRHQLQDHNVDICSKEESSLGMSQEEMVGCLTGSSAF